jgi:hypothetical protein
MGSENCGDTQQGLRHMWNQIIFRGPGKTFLDAQRTRIQAAFCLTLKTGCSQQAKGFRGIIMAHVLVSDINHRISPPAAHRVGHMDTANNHNLV